MRANRDNAADLKKQCPGREQQTPGLFLDGFSGGVSMKWYVKYRVGRGDVAGACRVSKPVSKW